MTLVLRRRRLASVGRERAKIGEGGPGACCCSMRSQRRASTSRGPTGAEMVARKGESRMSESLKKVWPSGTLTVNERAG